jgi:hypothetical protein
MITMTVIVACVGMVAGFAAAVLGVAQLTCEHAESGWTPRASTVALSIMSAWTGIDCWEVWAGTDDTLDVLAVLFCCVLAVSWAHRRVYGLTTEQHRRPSGTTAKT